MRASALEKLKLERKVCQEDNLTYSSSPKKKVELDAKIEENKIEEEEISQDDLKSLLMPDLKGEKDSADTKTESETKTEINDEKDDEKHVNGDS